MAARLNRTTFALACALTLGSTPAAASPPGHWAISVERLFGLRHTSLGSLSSGTSENSISVGTQYLAGDGFSTPRVAADYLLDQGFSFGAALAYGTFAVDMDYDDYEDRSWLLAPRFGFFLLPLPSVGFWPRAGLTLLRTTADQPGNLSAVTLEAPVVFLLPGHILTCTVTPYAELGYSAGNNGFFGLLPTYRYSTELGLSLGATVFF